MAVCQWVRYQIFFALARPGLSSFLVSLCIDHSTPVILHFFFLRCKPFEGFFHAVCNDCGADIVELVLTINLRHIPHIDGVQPLEPCGDMGDALHQKTARHLVAEEFQERTVGPGGNAQCFFREQGLGEGGDPVPEPLSFAEGLVFT